MYKHVKALVKVCYRGSVVTDKQAEDVRIRSTLAFHTLEPELVSEYLLGSSEEAVSIYQPYLTCKSLHQPKC